ncbi:leucine-rich repeat-containing protein 46 [Aplysia californica]|uniref:Leucine-rich repeat-containing protein 46 n=1 Tax=Aplysia californica TaxID=6500 RepID=A0ABM0JBQ7_APLCA|nr:leucine-rich repeat-containing protein 46 [Aplysia californica]
MATNEENEWGIDTSTADRIADNLQLEKNIKPARLSLHLIVRRNLSRDSNEMPQEQIIDDLNKVKRVRLDRESIGEIDSLELLSSQVTHLYLQKNRIECIQNLECLPNLQVLVLSNNQIKEVEGLSHLQKLIFLDLSENCISDVDTEELPCSLVILNLAGNECVTKPKHREKLIQSLLKLKQLDGAQITRQEKLGAGLDISDDESSEELEDENREEDDEEKEQDDEDHPVSPIAEPIPINTQLSAYKQLPKIQASVQDFATEMLLRSQARLEESAGEHRRHIQEMTNSKIKARIRPLQHIQKPQ